MKVVYLERSYKVLGTPVSHNVLYIPDMDIALESEGDSILGMVFLDVSEYTKREIKNMVTGKKPDTTFYWFSTPVEFECEELQLKRPVEASDAYRNLQSELREIGKEVIEMAKNKKVEA